MDTWRLPELSRDRVAHFIIDFPECLAVDLADAAEPAACHEVAVGVEVLRLGEIREDIVFFVDEGEVESFRPEGDIDQ